MKENKLTHALCLILVAVLVLFAGALATVASAASVTYQMTDLLTEGKLKPLGRT